MILNLKSKLLLSAAVVVSFSQSGFIASAHQSLPDDLIEQRHSLSVPSVSADQMVELKQLAEKSNHRVADPLIIETQDGNVASGFLKDMQETLLRMNDLSYNLVKGGGKFLEFAVNEQEKLQQEGWVIKGFTALEGRRNTFGDVSGIVCFNRQKNVITVVYHGTANNKEGWETNFDGKKVEARKIQKELTKDLYEETLNELKEVAEKSNIKELKSFLKSIKSKDFSKENVLKAQEMIEHLIAKKQIDAEIGENLLHNFRVKLQLTGYLEKTGCKIEGEIHKGFAKKYYSSKEEVLGLLKEFVDTLTPEQKKSVKIVVSGHSQAGGTGKLALADITANHGKELFGSDFDNKTSGTFNGYLLSAARAGDKTYKKWMHENVGQDCIARQNVKGDPVPIAAGDKEMANLVRELLPGAGELLAVAAEYDDVGHLLYDDGHEAWQRAKGLYGDAGISLDDFEKLDDAVHYIASWMVDEQSIPEFVTSKKSSSSWNPFTKMQTWWNTLSTGRMIKAAMQGDEKAKEKLTKLLEQRYAHIHYGHHIEGVGATFNKDVVGRDLDRMLQQGHTHEMTKKAEREKAKQAAKAEKAKKKHER